MSACDIAFKDLKLLAKDRRAVVLLLVLPLLFISIVGMSTGQFLTRDENNQKFKVAVVDLDQSELSREVVEKLSRHRELLIVNVSTSDETRQMLRRGEASLLLTVGPEFEERVEELRISDVLNSDQGPLAEGPKSLDLRLEARPASAGLGRLLEGVVFSQVIKVVAPVVARKHAVARTWLKDRSDEGDSNNEVPSGDEPQTVRRPPSAAYQWIVPGFTVMFAFFLISVMARSFIAERENGTLTRLKLAPIATASILLGKTIPFLLTSLVQCSLLFVCGRLLFGMSWGSNPLLLVPVIVCTSLAATSLGLLLATMVQTDQQVSSFGTTLILLLSSISGCFFPRDLFPPLMKRLSLFTPHGWSLRAFDEVLTHVPVDATRVMGSCGVLVLFSAIFFAVGWFRFRSSR